MAKELKKLTVAGFKRLYPRSKNTKDIVQALNNQLEKHDINTPKRIAAFISQCGHESAGWRVFEENLNYSAKALDIVFHKYFKDIGVDANEYARQPEKIANHVYANRLGNGPEESGDGWKYRGRGPIQITGKNNYEQFGLDMNVYVGEPSILATDMNIGVLSALWFWNKHNLNKYADTGDIKQLTRHINGGYNGLQDRIDQYNKVLDEFSTSKYKEKVLNDKIQDFDDKDIHNSIPNEIEGVLRRGSRGDGVYLIQGLLGLVQDGIFGQNTEASVKMWQEEHGLTPDGIVGPKTLEVLLEA